MKVAYIQIQPNNYHSKKIQKKVSQPNLNRISHMSFKGGNGAIVGTGVGVIAAMLTLATAGAALPIALGVAAITGAGAGGAYIGNKVGDIISPDKKDKK